MPPSLDRLPTLAQSIRDHGLNAHKGLGQHFLLDPNILRNITKSAEPLDGALVVEIGPGPGGLTRALLEQGARVVAVEKDLRCRAILEQLASVCNKRLELVFGDAKSLELAELTGRQKCKIVANLPYNIGTELLIRWLHQLDLVESMHLLFQAEVGERLIAVPGNKTYGRLTVLAQALCRISTEFRLPPGAFKPPPKVESLLLSLFPLDQQPTAPTISSLENLTGLAFGQRRKMLRSSLRPLHINLDSLLGETEIEATMRADQVSVADYLTLAKRLSDFRAEDP